MKSSDIKKIRNKGIPELEKDLKLKQEALRTARFDLKSGKVKNIAMVKETKKEIARIKTFITEKLKENDQK